MPKGYPIKEPAYYRYAYQIGQTVYFNEWITWNSKKPLLHWASILNYLQKQKHNFSYYDYWVEYRYPGGVIMQGIKASDL
jgi:hypothetical protein